MTSVLIKKDELTYRDENKQVEHIYLKEKQNKYKCTEA
jgi:hypothetical protein